MAGFFRKTLSFLGFIEDDKEYEVKTYQNEEAENIREEDEEKVSNINWFRSGRKNVQLRQIKGEMRSKVFIIEVNDFDEAQIIGDNFKKEIPVIVNLQSSNPELSKRIIDFCSGLTYALEGSIQRAADRVFLITPYNVEVASDTKEMLQKKGLYDEI